MEAVNSDGDWGTKTLFRLLGQSSGGSHEVCEGHTRDLSGQKVFVLGESFGGMVAFHSLLREEQTTKGVVADGYILAGPLITLRSEMLPPKLVITIVTFLMPIHSKAHNAGHGFVVDLW